MLANVVDSVDPPSMDEKELRCSEYAFGKLPLLGNKTQASRAVNITIKEFQKDRMHVRDSYHIDSTDKEAFTPDRAPQVLYAKLYPQDPRTAKRRQHAKGCKTSKQRRQDFRADIASDLAFPVDDEVRGDRAAVREEAREDAANEVGESEVLGAEGSENGSEHVADGDGGPADEHKSGDSEGGRSSVTSGTSEELAH